MELLRVGHSDFRHRFAAGQAAQTQHDRVGFETAIDVVGKILHRAGDIGLHHAAGDGIERLDEVIAAIADFGLDGSHDERRNRIGKLGVPLDLGFAQRAVENAGDARRKALLCSSPFKQDVEASAEL